jgi:hypothetical protein
VSVLLGIEGNSPRNDSLARIFYKLRALALGDFRVSFGRRRAKPTLLEKPTCWLTTSGRWLLTHSQIVIAGKTELAG